VGKISAKWVDSYMCWSYEISKETMLKVVKRNFRRSTKCSPDPVSLKYMVCNSGD